LAKLNLLDDNSDLTFFIHSFQAKQKETSCSCSCINLMR